MTREDGSLLITTNGTFHLHGSYQRNSTKGGCMSMTFWLEQQLAQPMEGADLFHRSGSPRAPGRGAEPEMPGQTPRQSR